MTIFTCDDSVPFGLSHWFAFVVFEKDLAMLTRACITLTKDFQVEKHSNLCEPSLFSFTLAAMVVT